MRIAFLILIVVNLALFSWGEWYRGRQEEGREPHRMAQQVAVEKLRIIPPPAPPQADAALLPAAQ
jgi:hypothetical protein